MTEETTEVKKTCWLARLSILCLVAVPLIMAMAIPPLNIFRDFEYSLILIVPALLVITFLLSIIWLIKIGLNKGKLKGARLARALAFVSCLLFMGSYHFFMTPWMEMPHSVRCGTNLKGIGTSILICASDHDEMLPGGNKNWCDTLIMEVDLDPKVLMCEDSGAVFGESSYALNRNLVGKNILSQGSAVVTLFETNLGAESGKRKNRLRERDSFNKYPETGGLSGDEKVYLDRWNQVGGPEDLTIDNHEGRGCNVLFGDGHVEFVKAEDIGKLRWTVE